MRTRTRGQLLARLLRYGNKGTRSASDLAQLRAYLDDAYATVWTFLTGSEDGFGLVTYPIPLAPNADLIVLPENFLQLRAVLVGTGAEARTLERTTQQAALRRAPNTGRYPRYWLEGPGKAWNGMEFLPYDLRLRFDRVVPGAEVVTLVYQHQPVSLADADGQYVDVLQDDTIAVDVIAEPIEAAIVGWARYWSAGRHDDKETARAQEVLRQAVADYTAARARDRAGAVLLSDY